MKNLKQLLAIAILPLVISCGSDNEGVKDEAQNYEERVRPAASGGTSAAYFTYENSLNTADTLLSVKSDIAVLTQVHESYETEEGMMGMREQNEVGISPGEVLVFKQGGLHVMLMRLKKDLLEGDSVRIELEFAKAGLVTKILPVKP